MSRTLIFGFAAVVLSVVAADERRAPRPQFSEDQLRGVFFEKLDDAFRGQRPSLSSIRKSAQVAPVAAAGQSTGGASSDADGKDVWSPLIGPASLEDEVKRLRLHYDSVVTTPGAFNSGGYQDARLDLTALASLFAVINEYGGEVRWKDQAAVARDLIARTAFNCKAGSTQVYNEAKLRKADLQDLVSGTGITGRESDPDTDWTMIADRSPMMEYAELLVESLDEATRNEGTAKTEVDSVRRNAELLAMVAEIFTREGMDEADDEDYVKLSHAMRDVAKTVVAAIDRSDWESVTAGASLIRQRCDACHEEYR
jgi:cytochrome c556